MQQVTKTTRGPKRPSGHQARFLALFEAADKAAHAILA